MKIQLEGKTINFEHDLINKRTSGLIITSNFTIIKIKYKIEMRK